MIIANVVRDLKATVRVLATGAPKVSGTIYVAIRLELDGDADDGKRWCSTHSTWETSPHAFPEATYDAAGDWIYQLPAAATTSKVSTTKPARVGWRMTDNVASPASETCSSSEYEYPVYSAGAVEPAVDAAAFLDLTDGIESGVTPRQALRAMAAVLAGLASGGPDASAFKGIGQASGGTTRVSSTTNAAGDRSDVTLNL